jgi:hypothetical protein
VDAFSPQTIDQNGVGQLIQMAVQKDRSVRNFSRADQFSKLGKSVGRTEALRGPSFSRFYLQFLVGLVALYPPYSEKLIGPGNFSPY